MAVTGNKGEWSEFYTFLQLLAEGKLYAANDRMEKDTNIYFPILKIIRQEEPDKIIEFCIDGQNVNVVFENQTQKTIQSSVLGIYASHILSGIKNGGDRAFEISESAKIMSDLECNKIKAPSTDKADITLQLLDIHTGYSPICKFSIKSELGHAPTLLNAGKTTNFVYEIPGISEEDMNRINALDNPKSKILDRISAIQEISSLHFVKTANSLFSRNLQLLDSMMEQIIAEALLIYYQGGSSSIKQIVSQLEKENPLGFSGNGFYEYKFKKFLSSVALGLVPSKPWDGRDEANGGYIVINEKGDVVTYHIYNRNIFEDYLFENTKFERASTTRHEYAQIYKDSDKYYINLNLQIRFIK